MFPLCGECSPDAFHFQVSTTKCSCPRFNPPWITVTWKTERQKIQTVTSKLIKTVNNIFER